MAFLISLGVVSLAAATIGPTLPALAAAVDVELSRISLLLVFFSLGSTLGTLAGGPILDAGRGRTLITSSLLLLGAVLSLVPLIRQLIPLTGAFLLWGAAAGGLRVGGHALLVWMSARRAARRLTASALSYGIGAIAGPLLAAWTLRATSSNLAVYWLLGAAAILLTVWLASASRSIDPETSSAAHPSATLSHGVILFALLLFFYAGAEVSASTWIYTHALRSTTMKPTAAAYLTSAFWAAVTVARLLAVRTSRAGGSSRLLYVSVCASVTSSLGLLFLSHSPVGLWMCIMALGASMAGVFPQTLALANARLGLTGRRTSALLIASNLGAMTLPWVVGQLIAPLGRRALPTLLTTTLLCAAGVLWAIDVRRKRQPRSA